jgi:hypothetical protein
VPGLYRYERQEKHPVLFTSTTAPFVTEEEVSYQANPTGPDTFEFTPRVKALRKFYSPLLTVSPAARAGGRGVKSVPDTPTMVYQHTEDVGNPPNGSAIEGEVAISVPVGEPILEASVMTRAIVKGGGSIVVSLDGGQGQRTRLYTCSSSEEGMHRLPDSIRGSTQIELVVSLKGTARYSTKTERRTLRKATEAGRNLVQRGLEEIHYRLIPEYTVMLFPSNENTQEVFRLKAVVAESAPLLDKVFETCPEILK